MELPPKNTQVKESQFSCFMRLAEIILNLSNYVACEQAFSLNTNASYRVITQSEILA